MIRLSSQTKSMPVSIIARGIKIGKIAQPAKAIIIDASQNKPNKRFSMEQVHSGETATINSDKNIEVINKISYKHVKNHSKLSSTISLILLIYSYLSSLYKTAASLLAGELILGLSNKLYNYSILLK